MADVQMLLRRLLLKTEQSRRDPLVERSALLPGTEVRRVAQTAKPYLLPVDDWGLIQDCSVRFFARHEAFILLRHATNMPI